MVYEIIKKNATVQHRITFNPTCLSGAVAAYNLLPYQPDIALSVECDYVFTNIAQPTGTVYETELKDFGNRYKLVLDRQWMNWTGGADSVEMVAQNWITGKMRERVMMPKVAQIMAGNASAKIWHNTQTSIGAAEIEDAGLVKGNPSFNYGTATGLILGWYSASYLYSPIIRVLGVDNALGASATISACSCSLYIDATALLGTPDMIAYRVFKPWVEGITDGSGDPNAPTGGGGATWDDWDADPSEWGTAGCNNASDAGSDNNSDGSGYDRKATGEAAATVITAGNAWYNWSITAALAQGWYNNTINENGIILIEDSGTSEYGYYLLSTENATTANRPRFSFTYTTGGGAAAASVGQVIVVE